MNRFRRALAKAPLLLFVVVGGIAVAQTSGGADVPYVGFLEENGAAVTGERAIEVSLYVSEAAPAACDVFTFGTVEVAAGRFQVELSDVDDLCFASGELYAGLAVGPDTGALTSLSAPGGGRTRIGAVPFAAGSPRLLASTDLVVDGVLDFAGPDGTNELGARIVLWNPDYGLAMQPGELRTFLAPTARLTVGSTTTDGITDFSEGIALYPDGDAEFAGGVTVETLTTGGGLVPSAVGAVPVRIVRGSIGVNSEIVAGEGFTVTNLGTGRKRITFNPAFTGRPSLVVTQRYPDGDIFGDVGGDTTDNCVLIAASSTRADVKCGGGTGVATNRAFDFIAIGPS